MSLFDSIKKAFHPEATPPTQTTPPAGNTRNSSADRQVPGAPEGTSAPAQKRAAGRRLLFVGGDSEWFKLIERDIQRIEPNWLCQQTKDSAGARMAMVSVSFDVLVLDGRLSDGAKLLSQLEQRSEIICLLRRSTPDRPALDQWNCSPATMVHEDCNAENVVASIKKIERLRTWLAEGPIRKLLHQIQKLPVAPEIYTQISEHLESPNGSMVTVARLISQDPVMSAKILQVVNSVYFGLAHEVTDTAEAAMVLGAERVKSLILLTGIFSQYDYARCPGFSPEPIWGHSLQVAMFARTIAFEETKNAILAEAAFTAGLLHDVGKLILAANLPELYATAGQLQTTQSISQPEAELKVLGTTHAEFAACLLGTWGLPLPVLEAIAWHHEPQRSADTGFSLMAAVHVANVFAHESTEGNDSRQLINDEFLQRCGLGDCRDRWRKSCGLAL